MDKAKASVSKILGRSGQHDTTIHETVAPAVQHETVSQTQHERETQAIDREVHQDHYHTTEQPVHHSEVLPEQHHHREREVEHRSFEHDSPDVVKRKLAEQASNYRDHSTRVAGESTRSAEPTVMGEHKHHHVHETIQPVVQKQTIEPHVVHTTKPVHEVHHNEAQHHSASALPAVSMEDFKKKGGALTGREERTDHFSGEPRSFGGHDGEGGGRGATNAGMVGDDSRRYERDDGVGSNMGHTSSSHTGSGYTGDSHHSSSHVGTDGGIGREPYGDSSTTNTSSTSGSKPSMMDKLNPKVDATGDGKAGFMK